MRSSNRQSAPGEFRMPSSECRTRGGLKFEIRNSAFEISRTRDIHFCTLCSVTIFHRVPRKGWRQTLRGGGQGQSCEVEKKGGDHPRQVASAHGRGLPWTQQQPTVERNQHRMKTQFLLRGFRSARTRKSRAIGAALATLAATAIVAQAQPVQIVQQFQLPPLSYVDLGYTQEQVDQAVANGLAFTDRPGLASGLQRLVGNHFLSVSDRGPNFTVAAGRVFPLPAFTPSIIL